MFNICLGFCIKYSAEDSLYLADWRLLSPHSTAGSEATQWATGKLQAEPCQLAELHWAETQSCQLFDGKLTGKQSQNKHTCGGLVNN